MDEQLTFGYPDKITKAHLPGFESPDPQRTGNIATVLNLTYFLSAHMDDLNH
jgi:hypothetical protein